MRTPFSAAASVAARLPLTFAVLLVLLAGWLVTGAERTAQGAVEADLSITMTDDPDPVLPGGTLTYTVTVTNNGPDTAEGVIATDTLPDGVTWVAMSGCPQDAAIQAVLILLGFPPTCSIVFFEMVSGATLQFTIDVTLDAGTSGTLTNEIAVISDTADPNTANNSASEDTVVEGLQADLSISKTDDVDPVDPGGTLTYTLTVTNVASPPSPGGPEFGTAENVVVTDTLPAGVTLVATSGCAEDPGGLPTCSLGDIAAGGTAQFTIEVTVDGGASGTLTNNASVSSDTLDPNPANDDTSEDTGLNPPPTDLAIEKTGSPDAVAVGGTLTYTVTVTNNGPNAAQNVVVADTQPAGVSLVAAPGCGIDPVILAAIIAAGERLPPCPLGDLAAGESAEFTVEVTVDEGTSGTITNTATVSSDATDPNPANNSASVDTTVSGSPGAEADSDGDSNLPPDYLVCQGPCPGGYFNDAAEAFMGTDPFDRCPPAGDPSFADADVWPPDFNGNGSVNLLDVFAIRPVFGTASGDGTYLARFDLNASGNINLLDVFILRPFFGTECSPP